MLFTCDLLCWRDPWKKLDLQVPEKWACHLARYAGSPASESTVTGWLWFCWRQIAKCTEDKWFKEKKREHESFRAKVKQGSRIYNQPNADPPNSISVQPGHGHVWSHSINGNSDFITVQFFWPPKQYFSWSTAQKTLGEGCALFFFKVRSSVLFCLWGSAIKAVLLLCLLELVTCSILLSWAMLRVVLKLRE